MGNKIQYECIVEGFCNIRNIIPMSLFPLIGNFDRKFCFDGIQEDTTDGKKAILHFEQYIRILIFFNDALISGFQRRELVDTCITDHIESRIQDLRIYNQSNFFSIKGIQNFRQFQIFIINLIFRHFAASSIHVDLGTYHFV